MDGDVTRFVLSIEDILILVDVVLGENDSQCSMDPGDITMDGTKYIGCYRRFNIYFKETNNNL